MKRRVAFAGLMLCALTALSQVNTFEKLQAQLTAPTETYQAIKHGADSLIAAWHAANPNATGYAPSEKAYIRWEMLAHSRHAIVGQPQVALNNLKTQAANVQLNYTYCTSGPSENPWQSLGPVQGSGQPQAVGLVSAIAVHPTNENIIYAGGGECSGLFKTNDGGTTWVNITDALGYSGLAIGAIAIDPANPDHILVGSASTAWGYFGNDFPNQGYGIMRSTNGGQTWTNVTLNGTNNPGSGMQVTAIRFTPGNSNSVWVTTAREIWRSIDNGLTWIVALPHTAVSPDNFFIDLEIAPGNANSICASTIFVGQVNPTHGSAKVYCSDDGGQNFFTDSLPNLYVPPFNTVKPLRATRAVALAVTPTKPNTIFAFFANSVDTSDCISPGSYLYKTTNGGRNWSLIQGEAINATSRIIATGEGHWGRYRYQFEVSDTNAANPVIYIGGDVLLRRNLNVAGNNWQLRSQYTPTATNNTHADIRGIVNRGNSATGDKLFIANDGGISKTTNSGKTWANLNGAGLAITEFHGFASWKNSDELYGGAMHNAWARYQLNAWKIFEGSLADGGYTIGHPQLTNIGYTASGGDGNYPVSKFQLNSNGTISTFGLGINKNTPLWSKFDITKTAPHMVYIGVEGVNDLYKYNESTGTHTVAFDNTTFDSPEPISVVKVAPSNPNIIYLAFAGQPWNTIPVGKFWVRENDGSWMDRSQNIFIQQNGQNTTEHVLKYMFITDIAIDPLNPNRVWVGMAYYDPDAKNRVFYSSDGGLNWDDVSQGLPIFSINCLTYQEGSDDVIYAGTDGGVYYWDKPNNTWQCFNNGLPPAIVTKIDVHPCKGVLYASTYGRGMWQAPIIFSNGPAEPIAVNTTIPAGTTVVYEKNVAVQPGVTLTIQGTAKFARGKGLHILPGGKVVVDGGTLTHNPDCGSTWEGIAVLGDATQPQTPTHQGVLITKMRGTTPAVITNARTAISNVGWGGTDFLWGTQGGIIECANTTFINNNRDVQLISYHDVLPNGYEKDYKADFTHCTFTRDATFSQGDIKAHVTLWDVVGPTFSGCTFDVQNMAYSGPVDKKQGFYTIAAAYRLTNSPTNTGNTFTGYYKAIESKLMTRADKFITVKSTTFNNSLFGAHLECTSNARVLFNTFNVPGGSGLDPTINFSYGLYFDYSTGYTCTENTFIKTGLNNFLSAGAVFKSSGADYNQVYRNSFSKLSYGSQALDRNRSVDGVGLEYKCNNFGQPIGSQNVKNGTDALVAISALAPDPLVQLEYGIQENQGYFNSGASAPQDLANNLFSQILPFGTNYNLNNAPGMIPFFYYYDENATARMEPRYNVALDPQNANYLQDVSFGPGVVADYNLHCLPNVTEYGNPGKTVADLQATLSTADAVVQSKRNLYAQLLNGGNTPELEAEILFANQPDYMGLYIDLLSISPYVDVPQILDLINKNDFPEMALRNIILANPHAGRDPEVWDALLNRNPAISQQTLLDIESGSATRTAKDVLEAEIGFYSGNAQRSVNDLLFYYADSSYADAQSLKNLLQSRSEFTYALQLAEYYLSSGQYTALQNMWNSLDTEWYSEGDLVELPYWQSLYNTLRTAFADGQRYATLNSITLNSLQTLANQAEGAVKHRINAILRSYGLGTSYIEPMSFYDGNSNKHEENVQRPTKPAATFILYPNPAKDYFELRWNWFEQGINTDMRIVVRNLLGAQIMQHNIKDYKNNIAVIATNTLQPGVYLIEIQTTDGNILFVEKVTVIKE